MNPVADTPSVTNATTSTNAQTTSGLVATRGAADGAEVGFFKVTGITNGTLFLSDGTTQVANGSFVAFGAGGTTALKFTPTAGFAGAGNFQVQASLSASDGGLGGSAVTASITVNPAPAPTPTPITDDPIDGTRTTATSAQFIALGTDAGTLGTVRVLAVTRLAIGGAFELGFGCCLVALVVAPIDRRGPVGGTSAAHVDFDRARLVRDTAPVFRPRPTVTSGLHGVYPLPARSHLRDRILAVATRRRRQVDGFNGTGDTVIRPAPERAAPGKHATRFCAPRCGPKPGRCIARTGARNR